MPDRRVEPKDTAIYRMLEGAGGLLSSFGQSPAFRALVEAEMIWRHGEMSRQPQPADGLNVKDDGVIFVEGFEEPIDLVRLRRTVGNIAKSLDVVCKFHLSRDDDKRPTHSSATRHLVNSFRAAEALALIMHSDEVSTPLADAIADAWSSAAGDEPDVDPEVNKLENAFQSFKWIREKSRSLKTHPTRIGLEAIYGQIEEECSRAMTMISGEKNG